MELCRKEGVDSLDLAHQIIELHVEAGERGIMSPASCRRYVQCRINGCTPQLAEALTRKKFPGIKTDSTFMKGKLTGDASFKTVAEARYYQGIADKAGVSTTGKHYYRGMARFPGDPEAWLDSRGDVERLATKRGWNVEGSVNVKAPEPDAPPERVKVAPDIVERETDYAMQADLGARREDVREQVYNRLSGAR